MADTSSVGAIIQNGEVVNANSSSSSNSSMMPKGYDKDSFMQILVAQMKYQDPLQPTSNTEYISQYATFSQVEQLSNMANAMSLSRASELVGKTVTIAQKNAETGETTEVQGVVDLVNYSGNEAYLNIDGVNYSVDDVVQVLDTNYTNALEIIEDFQKAIDELPEIEQISDEEHGETIDSMYTFYTETMTDKTRDLMDKNYVTALMQYVNRIDELRDEDYRSLDTETT